MKGWAIGIMTGTSVDGMDVALTEIEDVHPDWPTCRLADFRYQPFDRGMRTKILACSEKSVQWELVSDVHRYLAQSAALLIDDLLRAQKMSPSEVRVIGFHGQTVQHLPDLGVSWQVGDAQRLAVLTGIGVVSQFRAADLALGGQGAPLVPYFDYAVFRHSEKTRVILNIGGIANLTVIPAGAAVTQVIGFDTGPGNMVIDGLIAGLSRGRWRYDADGQLAGQGRVNLELLAKWMDHPFLALLPPKSTGREQFGEAWVKEAVEDIQTRALSLVDALATVTAWVAESIADAIRRVASPPMDVIVSGGGMHNHTLMASLRERLPGVMVATSDAYGIPGDVKEAMAFAYLAWQFLAGKPTNLPQVTGARRAVPLGCWTPPYAVEAQDRKDSKEECSDGR
ncbi:MAG: anhydro-N-acetylmuramic acid kinase [Sulfobacillus sp.]|nr:anhydro-N-acetylmuramic acid kinase [Sulfobacillus sp.]